MKQILEFIPILLFFIAYKFYDIFVATAVVIVATIIQVSITWVKYRKVEKMQWITLGLIIIMGGATLYLQDESFIKWKLTIIEWLFGAAFLGSQFIGKKTFVERMMGASLDLPSPVWNRLNLVWSLFFFCVGGLNLFVMYSYNTDDWVLFKTFVVPGLMVAFIILQMLYLYKYLANPEGK